MGKFLNWSRVIDRMESVVAIDLTLVGIASFNKVPTLELAPETFTRPSIRASSISSCVALRVTSSPSRILKVSPPGKFVRELPYLSIMLCISEALPVTTNSIFPIVWKAISLVNVDQVEVSVLSNVDPVRASRYWSQVSCILCSASVLELIPLM